MRSNAMHPAAAPAATPCVPHPAPSQAARLPSMVCWPVAVMLLVMAFVLAAMAALQPGIRGEGLVVGGVYVWTPTQFICKSLGSRSVPCSHVACLESCRASDTAATSAHAAHRHLCCTHSACWAARVASTLGPSSSASTVNQSIKPAAKGNAHAWCLTRAWTRGVCSLLQRTAGGTMQGAPLVAQAS